MCPAAASNLPPYFLMLQHDYYEALYTQSRARFDAYVAEATVSNNYAHLFDLLTRLRQAVCHPYLIQYGKVPEGASAAAASASDVCGICREATEDPVQTGCHHVFCRLCVREYLESVGKSALSMLRDATTDEVFETVVTPAAGRKKARTSPAAAAAASGPSPGAADPASKPPTCPTCFAPLTVDLQAAPMSASPSASGPAGLRSSSKSILARLPAVRVGGSFRSSSKIEALLEELWHAQTEEPGSKVRGG
jgi:SNF2 family DNA or RNA helicase